MIRTLFATTAIVAVLTGGAFAQSTPDTMNSSSTIFNSDTEMKKMDSNNGYFEANANQILASTLLGKTIYNGQGDNAEAIGDVNDVVLLKDGRALAVVVGVGGFLGLGEKEVAVEFARLTWVMIDNDRRLVMSATAEELKAAPQFDRAAIDGTDRKMAAADMKAETATTETQKMANATADQKPADAAAMKKPADTAEMKKPADTAEMKKSADTAEMKKPADTTTTQGMAAKEDPKGAMGSENNVDAAANPRENLTMVDVATISSDDLLGARVYGSNNEDVGEIGQVIVSPEGKLVAYVVDVGGFLGMGEKPVALDATDLKIMATTDGDMEIHTPYTQAQLKELPKYTKDSAMMAEPAKKPAQ